MTTTLLLLRGTRFGAIEYDADDVVEFAEGLIGFEHERRFLILSGGEGTPFRWLQSLATAGLAFLLADPFAFRPDYEPELSSGELDKIGLSSSDPYLLWTTAGVPAKSPRAMTLNLAAPILVNPTTRAGRQVVLDGDRYPVRAPAFSDSTFGETAGTQRAGRRAA